MMKENIDKGYEKPFCSYCNCNNCKYGESREYHAFTENDNFICSTCWNYDVCPSGPCEDFNCSHRPKLKGPWENFEVWKRKMEGIIG